MASPWQPRTDVQRAAVKRLARSHEEGWNGLVRSLPDGNDELLVKSGGSVQHYLVAEDGSSRLLEEHPPPSGYEWRGRLFYAGFGLFVLAAVVWMALPGGPHRWAFLLVPAAFAVFYAADRCGPNLKQHTKPDERWRNI